MGGEEAGEEWGLDYRRLFFALQGIMNLSFRDVVFKWHFMDATGFVEVVTAGAGRKGGGGPGRLSGCMEVSSSSSHQPISGVPFSWAARFISLIHWGFVYNIMEGND